MSKGIEKLMKEFKRKLQKIEVKTLGQACFESKIATYSDIERSGEEASKSGGESIIKATKGLESTIKGQFGKKITTVFEEQKKMLDDF